MIKTNLELRDYQLAPANFALEKDIAVLALAPNSGKSEISIYVISEYLRQNKKAKVLFMPHGTNVLLDNIITRMDSKNVDFTYSKNLEDDVQVHIKLPHHEKELGKNKYDFIVVDEAHEHYHAARMPRIIKACNPKKQLLLTGTPEKFIRKGGYDIFPLAANDIAEEWFAKLNVELVASNYKWGGHYNEKQNINDKFKFYKEDSRKTLESVVLTLLERVKGNLTADEFNKIKIIPTIKSWFKVSKKIGKTLITCQRTVQADQIYKILKDQGVNVGVSHSKSDLESEEVAKFKRGEYDIMVVVNRARLGYSDDDLMNVIDMSGTHNPSLIYQTFARALRGTPDQQKYYLKVTPQGEGQIDLTHMSVCAALMLTDKRYLSTYNGRNFNGIVIPVKKIKKSGSGSGGSSSKKKKEKVIFPDFSNDVIDMFKNVISNFDKPASIYKAVTIGEVRDGMGIPTCLPKGYWTYEKCKDAAEKCETRMEFKERFPRAYAISNSNGWLDEFIGSLKDSSEVDISFCVEKLNKCQSIKEFREKYQKIYDRCCHQGKLREIYSKSKFEYRVKFKYSYEDCKKEASKHKTKTDFRENSPYAYRAAIKNGWLEDVCGHMPANVLKKWPKEKCIEVSLLCESKMDLHKKYVGAYSAAQKHGWLNDLKFKQDLIEA